ncbi:MAG: hypothetical protein PG981_000336 [Wolbachia endosymbiont of Ctenocephalides orientis wCori]|nr:MAG: hypothetical protein PG981_000336 [Wolbachia endosymbiont of Ctenocephalides orientis wCori]
MILKKFVSSDIKEILSNQETIDRINATDFLVLKTIVNDSQLSGDQVVSLYKNGSSELKVERNMRLAVLLHKKDYIKGITIECLLDDNRIHWYIVDYLYKLYDFCDRATENLIEDALEREFHPNEESYKQCEAVVSGLEEQHILSKVCISLMQL